MDFNSARPPPCRATQAWDKTKIALRSVVHKLGLRHRVHVALALSRRRATQAWDKTRNCVALGRPQARP